MQNREINLVFQTRNQLHKNMQASVIDSLCTDNTVPSSWMFMYDTMTTNHYYLFLLGVLPTEKKNNKTHKLTLRSCISIFNGISNQQKLVIE